MLYLQGIGLALAECPCFSTDDLNFLDTTRMEARVVDIDIHRKWSCKTDESGKISLRWAYIDPERRTKSRFVLPVDGVKYNLHTARYSLEDPSKNLCGSEDWLMGDLTAQDAKSCFDLLKDTCEILDDVLCPCFSLGDLELAEDRIVEGELILDEGVSCNADSTFYGLYQKSNYNSLGDLCDMCTTPLLTVNAEQGGCMNGSDIVYKINEIQTLHCLRMMNDACAAL